MNYCVRDVNPTNLTQMFFCDFNNQYYSTYKDCYNDCGLTFPTGGNNVLVHISNVDFTFLMGIWAVLLSVAFFFAFHISHD